MVRSIDDVADIHGRAKKAVAIEFCSIATPAPEPRPSQEKIMEAKANGHKFCSYMDGNEAAVVRGLAIKR